MSTNTTIRFLFIQETLEDRSLISILYHEGHEICVLTERGGAFAPLPEEVVVTDDLNAALEWDPAVVVFPKPYVGQLAQNLIKDKRFVVGSSIFHHSMASPDRRYASNILASSGLPHVPLRCAYTKEDLLHFQWELEASEVYQSFYYQDRTGFRSSAMPEMAKLAEHASATGAVFPLTIYPVPADTVNSNYSQGELVMLFSGKQVLPEMFRWHHDRDGSMGALSLIGEGKFCVPALPEEEKIAKRLAKTLLATQYTGTLSVRWLPTRDGRFVVMDISAGMPDAFWPAFYFMTDYRDGIGKALLHMGRGTLKALPLVPDMDGVIVRMASYDRCSSRIDYAASPRVPDDYCVDNGFIPVDVVHGAIQGPRLGWVSDHLGLRQHVADYLSGGPATLESSGANAYNEEYEELPREVMEETDDASTGPSIPSPGRSGDSSTKIVPEQGIQDSEGPPGLDQRDGHPGQGEPEGGPHSPHVGHQHDGDIDHPDCEVKDQVRCG